MSYDFRQAYPQCVKDVKRMNRNCTSGQVFAALSTVEDHICKDTARTVNLAIQELVDCDKGSFGCGGGNANKALTWGKRKGFIEESCYPYNGEEAECPEEHLMENNCRQQNQVYKVVDFCLAQQPENIKREILTNGPVVGQMQPYTDFLTYKEGTYHRTGEAFKFQGNHVVKVLGWDSSPDGSSYWIIENMWGSDWGE